MKQVFRASDLQSIERLERMSGTRRDKVPTWYQRYERGTGELTERYDPLLAEEGLVRVTEEERARYDRNELLAIGSRRHSSLVRFTFGSGYTQFAGATIPMVSQYHISFDQYQGRRREPWPTAPGAFTIKPPKRPTPPERISTSKKRQQRESTSKKSDRKEEVDRKFLRGSQAKKKTSQTKK